MADYDYIVVGSGFGGSVAALRLAEKGYKVIVLEAGRRFRDQDFAKSNWDLKRFLYWPRLGLSGIMRFDFFRGLMIMSGAGVGGGSLVYANTLIEPSETAFANALWPRDVGVAKWDDELQQHYVEAKRMLGVAVAPTDFPADRALKSAAEALGFGATFHPVNVGVYFGKPGETVDDPYFSGLGPARAGCISCGGCMIGCQHNAKNTLVKNYLYLAERRGVEVLPETEARLIKKSENGGYVVTVAKPGRRFSGKREIKAKGVILAAGVLGTLRLLLRCRDDVKTLTELSASLGTEVRTNSESIIGVRVHDPKVDFSQGVAIAAGVNPDSTTKIEAVRYPNGSDLIGLITVPLIDSATILGRFIGLAREFVMHPLDFIKGRNPIGFARQTILLLVMQTVDSKLTFDWRRGLTNVFRGGLMSRFSEGQRPAVHLPQGNALAREMATALGGVPGGSIMDLMGMSITAHILGGCPMGQNKATSVIDGNHEVHGYPGLYVLGGAAVPANLGVNPSLTITAMAERAISRIPSKDKIAGNASVA